MVEAMQIGLMFIYACISFGNIFRDHKLAGEFVTRKKKYEEVACPTSGIKVKLIRN
jgi:hypothetical protein